MIVLSYFQAGEVLDAIKRGLTNPSVSLDLGITKSRIEIKGDFVVFPDMQEVSLEAIRKISNNNKVCFFIEDSQIKKVQTYSTATNKFYKLLPSGVNTAPAVEISGIRMHAVKHTNPIQDAESKISSILPLRGIVLDTCTGGGYTAIQASRFAKVYTYEIDNNVVEIAKYNPWSGELFNNKNIHLVIGDIVEEIKNIRGDYFDSIIHDPPSFKIYSMLYTQEFYSHLYRVLKPEGKMYHYIGSPGGKKGINIEKGIIKRLNAEGFELLKISAKGVVVRKY